MLKLFNPRKKDDKVYPILEPIKDTKNKNKDEKKEKPSYNKNAYENV